MKSNVKIYNNSNLDTKVVGYGGSTIPIKIYHNSLDYQTGNFVSMTFSVNDSSMWRVSPPPIAPSQLWFESPAIRFDWNEVIENDFSAWTVAAEALKWYNFSHWLLNWKKPEDNVMYILREDSTIQAVFKPADITITFYNDETWQWYDFPSWWTMLTSVNLQQWYYVINWMYQKNGLWYLDITDASTETHFQWYFIPESWWSYTWLEINWKAPTFPYYFWTSDLTIVASTEQADALIIESNKESWRWVDSSWTYIASPKTIPYTNINIHFEWKRPSPNNLTSLRFYIEWRNDDTTFNYNFFYEYADWYNTYLELDGTSMSTSENWSKYYSSWQHTLDARATEPLWKYYWLTSSEKTTAQSFINSSDNCLWQKNSSVNSYSYCFCNTYSGITLYIDKYRSNFMWFIGHQWWGLSNYACWTDSKLSNMDFNVIVQFERQWDTSHLERVLTDWWFSSLDDFCEYVMTTFNLS